MNETSASDTGHSRFAFGRNWKRFLPDVTDARIALAQDSLRTMLGIDDLRDKCFLDIGSGSGLFSLAAKKLRSPRVFSFDYDHDSVACTRALKERFFTADDSWQIEQGSVLDPEYMGRFRDYDVVYSWGVLHHTGAMWTALANAALPVAMDGRLYVAIYNDQGCMSAIWRQIKRIYCSGAAGKAFILATVLPALVVGRGAKDIIGGRSQLARYSVEYSRTSRGMSPLRDIVDWLGGYPFEVARPEQLSDFYQQRGFALDRLKAASGTGCHELVFTRRAPASGAGGKAGLQRDGTTRGSTTFGAPGTYTPPIGPGRVRARGA